MLIDTKNYDVFISILNKLSRIIKIVYLPEGSLNFIIITSKEDNDSQIVKTIMFQAKREILKNETTWNSHLFLGYRHHLFPLFHCY